MSSAWTLEVGEFQPKNKETFYVAFTIISGSRLPCEVVRSPSLEVLKQGFVWSCSATDAINIVLKMLYVLGFINLASIDCEMHHHFMYHKEKKP